MKHDTTNPDASPIQLAKIDWKTSKTNGRSFGIATFGDGQTCFVFDKFAGLEDRAFGLATFENDDKGQKLTGWTVTIPAGKKPEYSEGKPKPDQGVWDAKDRIIAMEAAQKPAGDIVAALINAKALKSLEEASDAYERLSRVGYNLSMKARVDRIDTDVNPLASE